MTFLRAFLYIRIFARKKNVENHSFNRVDFSICSLFIAGFRKSSDVSFYLSFFTVNARAYLLFFGSSSASSFYTRVVNNKTNIYDITHTFKIVMHNDFTIIHVYM